MKPAAKRMKRISTGLIPSSYTLVEMKVVPQMMMVARAARWPFVSLFSTILLLLMSQKREATC